MVIPKEIIAKETVSWDDPSTVDELGNSVDSSEWTLTYVFRGAAGVTLTAATEGTGWRTSTTVSSFTTAGTYYWQAILTKGGGTPTDRKLLSSGRLEVKANLADASPTFDGRSQIRKDLEAVQSAIRAIISGGAVQSYTIGTRSLTKMQISDLLALESKLKADLVREEKAEAIANGLGNPNNLFVRFTK